MCRQEHSAAAVRPFRMLPLLQLAAQIKIIIAPQLDCREDEPESRLRPPLDRLKIVG